MRDTVKISASPDGRGTHTFVCVFVWIPVIFIAVKPLSGFPEVTDEL